MFTAESFNLARPRVYLVISMLSASSLNLFCPNFGFLPLGFCVCVCVCVGVCVCVCVRERQTEKKDLNFFLLISVHQKLWDIDSKKLWDIEKIFIKKFIPGLPWWRSD